MILSPVGIPNSATLTIGIVAFAAVLMAGCEKQAETEKDLPLRIGMDLSYPPFETIDDSGRPIGVSVDLARALGERLQRSVVIENISFVGLIPALRSGKIDLVISSMSDTPERRKSIAFSDPYVNTVGLCVLAGADSGVTSAAQLDRADKVVVVRQGTTGQLWAQEHLRNGRVVVLEKEGAAVMEVVQGKADAFLYDQISVWRYHRQHPNKTVALLQPVKSEPWAIGLRIGDTELEERVNEFLAQFRKSGGFSELGDKYLAEQKADFKKQGIPFSF